MLARSAKVHWAVLLVLMIAGAGAASRPASCAVIDRGVFRIFGLRKEAGQWVTEPGPPGITFFVVDVGWLREHRDGDTLLEGHEARPYRWNENCGVIEHRPGGNGMSHVHVESGLDYPTQTWELWPWAVTQEEALKFWDVYIGQNGYDETEDAYHPMGGLSDGASFIGKSGSPNFYSNCYGYAFKKMLGAYEMLIDDGPYGAGVVLANECHPIAPALTNPCGTVMYVEGHANYVQAVLPNECSAYIATLLFKYRDSQVFNFSYGEKGRIYSKKWQGETPMYYAKN